MPRPNQRENHSSSRRDSGRYSGKKPFNKSSSSSSPRRDDRRGGSYGDRRDGPKTPRASSFSKDKSKKNKRSDSYSQKSYSQKTFSRAPAYQQGKGNTLEPVGKLPRLFSEDGGRFTNYFIETKEKKAYFDEFLLSKGGKLYRQVDPSRSKYFASIAKGISQTGVKEDSSILYLGASHGYTVSFLSDMLINGGVIYALDFAPRVVRDLVFLTEAKTNIAPMMYNANQPQEYATHIPKEGVDIVFMDIAQKNQVDIFLKNCDAFLKSGGFGLFALKSRSVDVTRNPKDIFKEVRAALEAHIDVVDYRELDPYEADHAFFVVKKK